MNKKEINVNEEMEKLRKKHKNIPTLRLFSSARYEELYGTEKLLEEYGANINAVISKNKAQLSKNIRNFKSETYVIYFYNEEAVNYIFKPTLKYLLEKQKEIDVIIAKIKRDIQKIN